MKLPPGMRQIANADVSYLDKLFFDQNGLLRSVSYAELKNIPNYHQSILSLISRNNMEETLKNPFIKLELVRLPSESEDGIVVIEKQGDFDDYTAMFSALIRYDRSFLLIMEAIMRVENRKKTNGK